MDFRAALIQCKADLLPVIGVRKRASIANKGGTTVTRPFYRGLEWLFFYEKMSVEESRKDEYSSRE